MAVKKQIPVNNDDKILNPFISYIADIFYIESDTDHKGTVESITKSVEFKGIAVWTLMFAVYIASIGLNTNSTAVIIGAMLISPLMGPIMGAGLAMGIYDFDLLKKSLRNLAVMTILSITTSALYFFISPLSDAQSELLARTYPTIYDVLIAVFGGATGIIAGSRKDKISNAIPGVAIATALMPPLCTAGYGLASGNLKYFAGAFYLYMINSVFIGLTTFLFVKYFKFEKKIYLDLKIEKRIHKYIYMFSILLIIPSVIMGYDVIKESTFKKNAKRFVAENFSFEKSRVLSSNFTRGAGGRLIEVTIVGEPLSAEMVSHLKMILPRFELDGANLRVIQSGSKDEGRAAHISGSTSGLTEKSVSKDDHIVYLETELAQLKNKERLIKAAVREVNILFPSAESISFGDLLVQNTQDLSSAKEVSVLVKWKPFANLYDKKRLELFLKSRLEADNLKVIEVK